MVIEFIEWLLKRSIKSKLKKDKKLSSLEILFYIFENSNDNNLTIRMPKNLKIDGLEDIVIDKSIRIHSLGNVIVTAKKKLNINPSYFKNKRSTTSEEIDRHFKILEEEYAKEQSNLNLLSEGINKCECESCKKVEA